MKKIKYLLLGIVSLLGIGCSFAWDYKSYGVRYFSNNNNQVQFNINGNTEANFGGLTYFDNNSFNSITGYLARKGSHSELSSLSSFSFTGKAFYNSYISALKIYSDSNNGLGLYYGANNSASINALYLLSPLSDSFSKVSITSSIPYFININVSDSCIYTGVINDGGCSSINSYEIIGDSITYSDLGVIHDSQIDGVDYNKGLISYSVGNTYSFWIITGDNSLIYPKTVYRTSTGYVSLNGYFISRVDNFNVINNNSDFDILVLSVITGSVNDYVWLYSVYTCPYNALDVSYCNYKDGGYLQENFTLTGGLFQFLASGNFCSSTSYCNGNYFSLIYSSISNSFTFSKVHSQSNTVNSLNSVQYSINLLSDNSINLLSGVVSPGGGYQSTYSGTVSLNNCVDTQVCYNTTGDNGEVLRICTTKCIDTGSIVSGSFVGSDGTIYYVDSPVDFSISSDGLVYDTGYLDSDGILSIDYYSGLFNGDSSFKLGVCPYPASNLLSFATKIKLGNFYPFMPLNCFISAFQQGAKVHFFDDFGLFPDLDSQLINGNTNFHITLYRFFDFLLSIGLLFILSALHRLLVK